MRVVEKADTWTTNTRGLCLFVIQNRNMLAGETVIACIRHIIINYYYDLLMKETKYKSRNLEQTQKQIMKP